MIDAEAKKQRTKQRRRTGELVKAVALGVPVYGVGSARIVVVEFAGYDSIPELAEAMAVNRSGLWQTLGFYRMQHKHDIRRECDRFLGLSPGGMHEVLEPIESLVMEGEEEEAES